MEKFDISLRVGVTAPNLKPIVSSIKNQVASATNINTQGANRQMGLLLQNVRAVTFAHRALNSTLGTVAGYSAATIAVSRLAGAMSTALSEAMKFQRSMIALEQVGAQAGSEIRSMSDNILKLSTSLGVSSLSLAENQKYLKGAGLSVQEVNEATRVLAKVSLAPTFESVNKAREGLLSMISQFKVGAREYESAFDSINQVSKAYAVESEDLVEAIRRSGAAFAAASGDIDKPRDQLNQLIGLFTSVRATTRESAATIGTSLKTIFSNLQNNRVQNELKNLGVNLRFTSDEAKELGKNVEGNFIGAYEAVRRLHLATKNLATNSPQFSSIVEIIGGKRNPSKVIPLLQQFGRAQEVVSVAQASQNSLTQDAAKSQEAFSVKLNKVHESLVKLGVTLTNTKTFNVLIDGFATAATAAANLVEKLEPLLPLLSALAAVKLGQGLAGFVGSRFGAGSALAPVALTPYAASKVNNTHTYTPPASVAPATTRVSPASVATVAPISVALPASTRKAANVSGLFDTVVSPPAPFAVSIAGPSGGYDLVPERAERSLGKIFNHRTGEFEAPRGVQRQFFGKGVAKHLDGYTDLMPNQRYYRKAHANELRRRRALLQGKGLFDRGSSTTAAIAAVGESYYVQGDGTEFQVSGRQARANRAAIDDLVTTGGFGSDVKQYNPRGRVDASLLGSYGVSSLLTGSEYTPEPTVPRRRLRDRLRLRGPKLPQLPKINWRGVGVGAGFAAASFAPSVIESIAPGSKTGAGIGGALQGASVGAALGSVAGPWGAGVGAVIGGLHGLVTSLRDAEKQIKEVEFAKDFSKLTNSLEDALAGRKTVGEARRDVSAGLFAVDKGVGNLKNEQGSFWSRPLEQLRLSVSKAPLDSISMLESLTGKSFGGLSRAKNSVLGALGIGADTSKQIEAQHQSEQEQFRRERLAPVVPQLRAFAGRIAGQSVNLQHFNAQGGNEVLQKISEGTGISLKELQAEIVKEITARHNNIRVMEVQNRAIQEFSRISHAFDAAANSIAHLETSADALANMFHGNLSPIAVRNRSVDATLGNVDTGAFNAATEHVASHLGVQGAAFGETARGLNKASLSLPGILNAARAKTAMGDDEGLANNIRAGISQSDIPAQLASKLTDIFSDIKPDELGQKVSTNIQSLVDEVVERAAPGFGALFQNVSKQLNERANSFASGLTTHQGMLSTLGESRDKSASLQLQANRSRDQFLATAQGRAGSANVGIDAVLEPFRQRQQRLTGLQGPAAFNPELIGSKLASTHAEIGATKAARDSATGPAQTALTERLVALQGNAQRLTQALGHLADSSERTAAVQEQLSRIEEDRQGKLGYTEKFLTSDVRGQRQMQRNAALTDAAFQQGHFGGFNAAGIQSVLEHLNSLGGAELPGYGNRKAADVRENLLRNSGVMLGTIQPQAERNRLGLLGAQGGSDAVAVKANEQLVKAQETLQREFFANLTSTEQEFLTKLAATLGGGQKQPTEKVLAGQNAKAAVQPQVAPHVGANVVNVFRAPVPPVAAPKAGETGIGNKPVAPRGVPQPMNHKDIRNRRDDAAKPVVQAGAAPQLQAQGLVGPPVPANLRLTKRQQLIRNNHREAMGGNANPAVQGMIDAQNRHVFGGMAPAKRGQRLSRDQIIRRNHAVAPPTAVNHPARAAIDEQRGRAFTGVAPPPKKQQTPQPPAPANRPNDVGANFLGKGAEQLSGVADKFDNVFGKFMKSVQEMEGIKMAISKQGKVEVVLNGAEVMKSLTGDLAQTVTQDIMKALQTQLPRMMADLPAHS